MPEASVQRLCLGTGLLVQWLWADRRSLHSVVFNARWLVKDGLVMHAAAKAYTQLGRSLVLVLGLLNWVVPIMHRVYINYYESNKLIGTI